jgi:glycine cleavage system H protein
VSDIGVNDAAMPFFMMGEFKAVFPSGLKYTTNHMWAAPVATENGDKPSWRFGLTSYAVRLLQDVYFLDWIVDSGTTISRRQQLGSIESKKAESDLYSPAAGRLISYNQQALADPSVINVDIYDQGWLLQIAPEDESDLLDVDAYLKHLEQAWVVAQRTIKGQV